MKAFSENLKKMRAAIKWTQEKTAARLGVKRSLYGAWEVGRSKPNPQGQWAIMHLFSITDWEAFCTKEDFTHSRQNIVSSRTLAPSELEQKFLLADDRTREAVRVLLSLSE